jgi:hypothetical protein
MIVKPAVTYVVTSTFFILIGIINTCLLITHVYIARKEEQAQYEEYVDALTTYSNNVNVTMPE